VPFVSDVRVFNTSYTDVLSVTAVYRFNGTTQSFQLAPREARAFDDICVSLFSTPQSLGAVEFSINGSADELVVTSQLRSPADVGGHVGMFVPGLPSTAASVVTVLTNLVNGPSRTNVGVYNPNGISVTATIRLFDGGVLLGTTSAVLGPHAVTQINNIYGVMGFGSLVKTDGYATVESSDAGSPLFTYAAEADNSSKDLILIIGAKDAPAPAGFHPPTPTPTLTPTPTPTVPASIVVNLVATRFQWSFDGGGTNFTMHVGQSYELHISDGDVPIGAAHGFSGIPALGLSARDLASNPPATPFVVTVKPTAGQIGTFPFECNNGFCGSGHSSMNGSIQVAP
jgi:heme/copper-type cytochrome/quinol oxidase subunit 2